MSLCGSLVKQVHAEHNDLSAAFHSVEQSDARLAVENKLKSADKLIDRLVDQQGAYTVLFTCNDKVANPILLLITAMTVVVQTIVPLQLISVVSEDDSSNPWCPGALSKWSYMNVANVRVPVFLLTAYICTSFAPTIERAYAMFFMAEIIETKRRFAFTMGSAVILISSLLTASATMSLFQSSPHIADMLLNCMALTFLPTIDVEMRSLMEVHVPHDVDISAMRMNMVRDTWPDSSVRRDMARGKRIKHRHVRAILCVFYCWLSALPFINFMCILPGGDGRFAYL